MAWSTLAADAQAFPTRPAKKATPFVDISQLHDITGIEKLPPRPPSFAWKPWLAVVLVLLLCVCFLVRKLVRGEFGKQRKPPPAAWALSELDRIEQMALPDRGCGQQYHVLVADVVRRYLELRYGPPALQLTSAEFLREVGHSALFAPGQRDWLHEFFERCDLAKFAHMSVSSEECAKTGALARTLLSATDV